MRRDRWWCAAPVVALLLVPSRVSGQMCDGAIDATARIVDMTESGGVGLRVRTVEEEALHRLTARTHADRGWPPDTSVRIHRVAIRIELLPAPRDSLPRRMRITVVHPD